MAFFASVNFCPPKQPPFKLPAPQARAAPVIIVLLALLASGALFYFRTSKRMQEQAEKQAALPTMVEPVTAPAPPAPKPEVAPKPALEATAAKAPAAPEKPNFGFARPLDLGKDLAQSLTRNDLARASQLATAGASGAGMEEARAVFEKLKALGYQVGPQQVEVMGQVDRFTRLAIPLEGPEGTEPQRLQIDLERDENMGWKIARFRLPPVLASAVTAPPAEVKEGPATAPAMAVGTQAPATTAAAATVAAPAPSPLFVVEETKDALTYAGDFVKSLLGHQFAEARSFLDESRVSGQKLAGLCIVFEEGQYEIIASKPLVMTVVGEDAAWVIAQVRSEKLDQQTEFGIELQRAEEGKAWRVVGLNLSDILGSFAQSATKIGVPYTPIVKNPRGGESLALYFEYDDSGLHPRARKQLQIVADLLKSDANRKLRIAGHADAMGAEDYNLRLSRQRAESVKKELVALGVTSAQIDTTGIGTAEPLGPNQKSDGSDDPEGRSKNRRAEIYLDF